MNYIYTFAATSLIFFIINILIIALWYIMRKRNKSRKLIDVRWICEYKNFATVRLDLSENIYSRYFIICISTFFLMVIEVFLNYNRAAVENFRKKVNARMCYWFYVTKGRKIFCSNRWNMCIYINWKTIVELLNLCATCIIIYITFLWIYDRYCAMKKMIILYADTNRQWF